MVIFVFWGSAPRILTMDRGCHGRRQAVGIPIPRRKRCLFLPGIASEHLPRRLSGVFLLGRRLVSHSAPEKMPFSARNRLGAPSALVEGHFSARQAVVSQIQKAAVQWGTAAFLTNLKTITTLCIVHLINKCCTSLF